MNNMTTTEVIIKESPWKNFPKGFTPTGDGQNRKMRRATIQKNPPNNNGCLKSRQYIAGKCIKHYKLPYILGGGTRRLW